MRRLLAVLALLATSTVIAPTAARAGGGCHGSSQASGSGSSVALSMNCMTPRVLSAPAGDVTFVNQDGATHNLVGDTWGVEALPAGQTFTRAFTPGTYVFACTLHPGMVGGLVVGEGSGADANVAAAVADVAPVRAVASAPTKHADDRLLLGLLLGALIGAVAAVGVRALRAPTA